MVPPVESARLSQIRHPEARAQRVSKDVQPGPSSFETAALRPSHDDGMV
jgi:hypothetical protein